MATLKEKAYDASCALHSSLLDIQNYAEFPVMLESVIKKVTHIDWICMAGFVKGASDFAIFANPYLPFNWGETYSEIYDYDKIRKDTMELGVGKILIYDAKACTDEGQRYAFEVVKKYTDTCQFLTFHGAKTNTFDSVIGFYRTDPQNHFSQEDKELIDFLSTTLVSITHMINIYREYDFQRVVVDQLRKASKHLSLVLSDTLTPIDIPQSTEIFLRKHFSYDRGESIPAFLQRWIISTIAPLGKLDFTTGPWLLKKQVPQMEIYCKAFPLFTELNQLVLLIQFIPHGAQVDFSLLQKVGLTKRETETLSYLPLGYSNVQIAIAMGIEEVTVKKHLKNSSDKLESCGRTELLYQALQTKDFLEALS